MVELNELVGAASTTLVAAMATDVWEVAKVSVRSLFGREPDRLPALESQLVANADLVARGPDAERARAALVPVWQLELEGFLARHPDAIDDLQALVDQVRPTLTQPQQQWALRQVNIARGNATQHVAGRDQHIHHHGPTDPTPPRSP